MINLFSSESVSEGHPDKLCDQVSDAILDAALNQDPNSRVAVECFTTTGLLLVGGELTTKAQLNIAEIAKNTISRIGYNKPEYGFSSDTCNVMVCLNKQSSDIAIGVDKDSNLNKELGAGDQGSVFGYACNQSPSLMPLPIQIAHDLAKQISISRKNKSIPYLRPDAKTQVTMEFENRIPKRIHTILISTQHNPEVAQETIKNDLIEQIIKPNVNKNLIDPNTNIIINPTGRFVIGGPNGDAGLTGRKIIVDTYGGWSRHGGGAFSGKDATKVDRSAAYMARYIAKNIVAANLADEIEIQITYGIGLSNPISITIETFNTEKINKKEIISLIKNNFNLTPEGIINELNLKKPIFEQTAAYGHFGRKDIEFEWEKTNKVKKLQEAVSKNLTKTTN
ncbi:methionine adenosyltransferase [Candidatus Marinamargulisbacteria bacterium SCGC AG-410-N11]|nr:methionine adenosyltransferase [Candidatus Marinamargulisbacteria bacterium SCGC AG-410-N11]